MTTTKDDDDDEMIRLGMKTGVDNYRPNTALPQPKHCVGLNQKSTVEASPFYDKLNPLI